MDTLVLVNHFDEVADLSPGDGKDLIFTQIDSLFLDGANDAFGVDVLDGGMLRDRIWLDAKWFAGTWLKRGDLIVFEA